MCVVSCRSQYVCLRRLVPIVGAAAASDVFVWAALHVAAASGVGTMQALLALE